MSKKRLAKQLWYGSEIDHEGNPVPPAPAVDGDNLSGLIEGEVYIHNHPDKPSLFIRTTDGKIHQVTGMDFDVLGQLFLSKTKDDRSKGVIASDKGFEVGEFTSGATGVGVYQNADGQWVIETDNLSVRRKFSANEVEIQTTNHIGGQTLLTAARMVIESVDEMADRFRCIYRKKDGEGNVISQQWKVGDQAFCNTFNLEKQADGAIGNHYYWREVVEVSANNWNEDYYYVDLSISKCASNSSIPKVGDKVVQLGYSKNDDADRQNAIIIAGAGTGSPYIQLFVGINSFVLPEPEQLKPGDNRLSGRLTIKEGSTGWQNLEGLPDSIQNAVDLANKAQETIDKTSVGAVNLLRNSGFTGDYKSEDMITSEHLNDNTELYSKKLDKWMGDAVVYADTNAVSGYSVQLGALSQSVKELITNESYVVSFKARGSSVVVTCGDFKQNVAVTSSYKTYSVKFTFSGSKTFEVEGNARICDLQLERGTIATDWNPSPYDNDKAYAEFQALQYLQDAIVNGSTNMIGGLILSSILKLGNFKDGVMKKVNAGVSGIYNNDDDVAFWAGGTLEQAIKTIIKFKENPQYNPTEEEWRRLASFVVSHGGDAIFKGSVFADNGYFRGLVYALGGLFKGAVEIADGKIKLNEDGSGAYANGNIAWDEYGVMYRKSPEYIVWVEADKYENYNRLLLSDGAYFDLTTNEPDKHLKLLSDVGFNAIVEIKKRRGSRNTTSIFLDGSFRLRRRVQTESGDFTYETADAFIVTVGRNDENLTLTFDKELNMWFFDGYYEQREYHYDLYKEAPQTDDDDTTIQGLNETVSITTSNTAHRLVFTNGILTEYTQESINDGN